MTLDSRTMVVARERPCSPYASSGPTDKLAAWIQPSISQVAIGNADTATIEGVYVRTRQPETDPWQSLEPALAEELEAWELASDEALSLYEEQLD